MSKKKITLTKPVTTSTTRPLYFCPIHMLINFWTFIVTQPKLSDLLYVARSFETSRLNRISYKLLHVINLTGCYGAGFLPRKNLHSLTYPIWHSYLWKNAMLRGLFTVSLFKKFAELRDKDGKPKQYITSDVGRIFFCFFFQLHITCFQINDLVRHLYRWKKNK